MKKAELKKLPLLFLPFIATAVMLTVIQPPFRFGWLCWVGFVPFILACSPDVKAGALFIAAAIVSFIYWLGNIYWMQPITTADWIAAIVGPVSTISSD